MVPQNEENRSGWHGNVHIYAPAVIITPRWATHERLKNCAADEIVIADCCLCKMRADETVCEIIRSPMPALPLPRFYKRFSEWRRDYLEALWSTAPYDPEVMIYCGPGFGCTIKPRRRSSRHLRER